MTSEKTDIQVEVFWVVTAGNLAATKPSSGWSILRHGILPQSYTASQPRRPRLQSSPPQKHRISKT